MTKQDLLASALSSEIRSGRYKAGDRLPSEPQLSQSFGVSRHTVRAALRVLHDLGLVVSHKGVGTIVQETRLVSHYSQSFSSAEDLLQYAATTRVRVIDRTEIVVDAARAAQFGCKPGEHWWRVRTVRSDPASHSVVAFSELHIPLAFGAALQDLGRGKQPIFKRVEAQFGEAVTGIEQDISCMLALTDDEARHLKVPSASPALQINRRYLGNGGRVLEVVRSLHPSDMFKYSMRVQLRHGA